MKWFLIILITIGVLILLLTGLYFFGGSNMKQELISLNPLSLIIHTSHETIPTSDNDKLISPIQITTDNDMQVINSGWIITSNDKDSLNPIMSAISDSGSISDSGGGQIQLSDSGSSSSKGGIGGGNTRQQKINQIRQTFFNQFKQQPVQGDTQQIDDSTFTYTDTNFVEYDFDWGQTDMYLYRDDGTQNDIDLYTNQNDDGAWKFGAFDNDLNDGYLNNYTYIINSTDSLYEKDGIDNNITYPVFYNSHNTQELWKGVEHDYNFEDICNKSYSNCQWIMGDDGMSAVITFTSDKNIDPLSNAINTCGTISNPGYYNFNTSQIDLGECFDINIPNVTINVNSYNITTDSGDTMTYDYQGGEINISVLRDDNSIDGLFISKKFIDSYEFGFSDMNNKNNELRNYTYLVTSTDNLLTSYGDNISNALVIYNDNYLPNPREYLDFTSVNKYGDARITQIDNNTIKIDFTSNSYNDPIINISACGALTSNNEYDLTADISNSASANCLSIGTGVQNVTLNGMNLYKVTTSTAGYYSVAMTGNGARGNETFENIIIDSFASSGVGGRSNLTWQNSYGSFYINGSITGTRNSLSNFNFNSTSDIIINSTPAIYYGGTFINYSSILTFYNMNPGANYIAQLNGANCTVPTNCSTPVNTGGTVAFSVANGGTYTLLQNDSAPVTPVFSNYWDNSYTLIDNGIGLFNVTLNNTNGTVILNINGTNVTATNVTANVYNASYTFIGYSGGSYSYKWYSFGNDSNTQMGTSATQTYVVNSPRITSCGTTLNMGITYNLMNNISSSGTCLTVVNSNSFIQGNGYNITGNINGQGSSSNGYNINITNVSYLNGSILTDATGADGGGSGYSAGTITVSYCNITGSLSATGYTNTVSGQFPGSGGTISVINSNITGSISSYGGYTSSGLALAGNSGSITLINSNAGTLNDYGAGNYGSGMGSSGAITILINSSVSTINDYGGSAGSSSSGSGGVIYANNSIISYINNYGGNGFYGGYGGSSYLLNCSFATISSYGGSTSVSSFGINGGSATLINSTANLTSTSINLAGGYGSLGYGNNGTLILNQTSFYNSFGKINFNYTSSTLTNIATILNISQNFDSIISSATYSAYNKSTNMYLYNTGISSSAYVLYNNAVCPASICSNLQNLGGDNYSFSATVAGNYSMNFTSDTTYPIFSNNLTNINNGSQYNPSNSYQFNITILNTNGSAGIEFNSVNYTLLNISSSYYYNAGSLGAGVYPYYYWAYGNGSNNNFNSTTIYYYTVNQATPSLTLTPNSPISYGTSTNFSTNEGGCPSQLSPCSLNITDGIFGAGTISANYSTPGNINYTSSSVVTSVTINKGIPPLILSSSNGWTIITSSADTITGSGCPSELICNLYESSLLVSNPYSNVFSAGLYNFTYNATGNSNYTSKSLSNILISTLTPPALPATQVCLTSLLGYDNPFLPHLNGGCITQ